MKILAILQNAYADPGRRQAILQSMSTFVINPNNYTGKKLYKLTEGHDLLVTNACPEVFVNVKDKGRTDLDRLKLSIIENPYDLYISCGKQSNEACIKIIKDFDDKPLILMPHPASRNLTNALISSVKDAIREVHSSTFGNLKALSANKTYQFIQLKGTHKLITINRKGF